MHMPMKPSIILVFCLNLFFSVFCNALAAADNPASRLLIAVFPLEDLRPSEDTIGLGESLAAGITDGLTNMENIQVVERERLQQIMAEIRLSASGMVDQQTAIRLGRLLGANRLVIGSFLKFRNDVRINIRMIQTETGAILLTARTTGKFDNIFDVEEKLVEKIARSGLR